MEQRVEKATTQMLPHGNRNKGFTFIELMVVMIIIAVMSAIVYPSFKKGLNSINEQRKKSLIELLLKRAMVQSRFDGKARVFILKDDGTLTLNGKKIKKGLKGVRGFLLNGEKKKEIAILPASFCTIGVVFDRYTYFVDLYTGEVEKKSNDELQR